MTFLVCIIPNITKQAEICINIEIFFFKKIEVNKTKYDAGPVASRMLDISRGKESERCSKFRSGLPSALLKFYVIL